MTTPAAGKVTWSFTASLDGFIAGPGHDMSWLAAAGEADPDVLAELAARVGVIISGRRGYDAAMAQAGERDELTAEAYGGAWQGIEFVLTHRPQELADDPAVTAMNCDIREAVARARKLAGGREVQIISADIARQALEHDLIDELRMFTAPIFLGDGTRVFSVPGGRRVHWERVDSGEDPERFGTVYRPRVGSGRM
ncbi:dihydrofolate reductase family protein [Microbacterium album]|uniref:Dihydrofolate reductase n=1 Tax=Microbacterium album TaxID=2053191 RepID=A0A917ML59_9MICO|nr:dihydrofolate reductase family protein [Microbacterium album]GGH38681.1 dihydrofolate reductase [Microbacterium album]